MKWEKSICVGQASPFTYNAVSHLVIDMGYWHQSYVDLVCSKDKADLRIFSIHLAALWFDAVSYLQGFPFHEHLTQEHVKKWVFVVAIQCATGWCKAKPAQKGCLWDITVSISGRPVVGTRSLFFIKLQLFYDFWKKGKENSALQVNKKRDWWQSSDILPTKRIQNTLHY